MILESFLTLLGRSVLKFIQVHETVLSSCVKVSEEFRYLLQRNFDMAKMTVLQTTCIKQIYLRGVAKYCKIFIIRPAFDRKKVGLLMRWPLYRVDMWSTTRKMYKKKRRFNFSGLHVRFYCIKFGCFRENVIFMILLL